MLLSPLTWLGSRTLAAACVVALAAPIATAQPVETQPVETKPEVFPAPAGTTAEILAFIESLAKDVPQGDTEDDLAAQMKSLRSIAVAAAQALEAGPKTPEEVAKSHFFRLQATFLLEQLDEPDAAEALDDAVAAARDSDDPQSAAVGIKFFIEARFARWESLSAEQRQDLAAQVLAYVRGKQVDRNDALTVMSVADFAGMQGEYQLGADLVKQTLPVFEAAEFESKEAVLPDLQGLARRLALPGNPLELEGATLAGETLDWDSYRGKVVLVDFWATWCGPCRAELPNMKKMYAAYHDQGFEVLGICLDDEPEPAVAFLKQLDIPWPSLFSRDDQARGWRDPRAVQYGVNGIPLAILVDREGKVVSMTATGSELKKLLYDEFGAPGQAAAAK